MVLERNVRKHSGGKRCIPDLLDDQDPEQRSSVAKLVSAGEVWDDQA